MSINRAERFTGPELRSGPRYLAALAVRAEWDDEGSGEHFVAEGETKNVGPQGALVHLPQLPDVSSRVRLIVPDAQGMTVQASAEVIRLERNPGEPLAAFQLLDTFEEWQGLVWESARIKEQEAGEDYEEEF